MTKHINNNSHNIQLRELQYEDELQGYDVQNAKRSKKKQVKKMKRDPYELSLIHISEPTRPY